MDTHPAAGRLLDWYALNARLLPWRSAHDPYALWVAEIMLQQTRVDTVIPYYLRWMKHFPDMQAVAHSSLQDVLSAWEGLGYYSRARNMHRAAMIMVKEHHGQLPNDLDAMLRLPGIGRSSAADILSIAYGKNLAALDGNIKRVVARMFDIPSVLDSPDFNRACISYLEQLLPAGKAGDFNQAMMDLGAGVCTPKNPACADCPLNQDCAAYLAGTQWLRPLPKPRKVIPHYSVTAGIIWKENLPGGELLIARRPASGLLGGLWEFPGGKQQAGESLEGCLIRELHEELGVGVEVGQPVGTFRHAYTHFRVTLHAFHCWLTTGEPAPLSADELKWVNITQLGDYPMGKLDRLITHALLQPVSPP